MPDVTLQDWVKQVEAELKKAKERAGPLAVIFGRFAKAEKQIYELKQMPDSTAGRRSAVYLLQSVKSVPPEQVPVWAVLGLGAAGVTMLIDLPKKIRKYHPAAVGAGLVVVGAGAQQYLRQGPSIEEGSEVRGDPGDLASRAEADLKQTKQRLDEEDTKDIEQNAQNRNRAPRPAKKTVIPKHVDGPEDSAPAGGPAGSPAAKSSVPVIDAKYKPEFHPDPSKPDPAKSQRFGFWKDGKFESVTPNITYKYGGRVGRFNSTGAFVIDAAK